MKKSRKNMHRLILIILTVFMLTSLCACNKNEDTTVNLAMSYTTDAVSLYITGIVKNYFSGVYTYAYLSDDIKMIDEKIEKEKLQRACVLAYMTVEQYKTAAGNGGMDNLRIVLIDNYNADGTIHGFWVARKDWIEQNKSTYGKTIKALLKAMNYRVKNMNLSYADAIGSVNNGYDIEYESEVMKYIAIYAKENGKGEPLAITENEVCYISADDIKEKYVEFSDGSGEGYNECLKLYKDLTGIDLNEEDMASVFDFSAVNTADITAKNTPKTEEKGPSGTSIILIIVFATAAIGAVGVIIFTFRKMFIENKTYKEAQLQILQHADGTMDTGIDKNKKIKKRKGHKKMWIVSAAVLLFTVIFLIVVYVIVPVSLETDIDSIEKVGTAVQIKASEDGAPVSLYKKDADGSISTEPFKILGFTDTHLDQNKDKGITTVHYMIKTIQAEKPDLVVIDGDVVTAGFNRKRVDELCRIMEKLEVYWIYVLGNHEGDNGWSISRQKIIEVCAGYSHCLVESSEKQTLDGKKVWGSGNTQLNILTGENLVAQSLFFLDSGDTVGKDDADHLNIDGDGDDFLKASQITWYKERIAALPEGTKSMMFIHIPLCEYKEAYETGTPVFGTKNERICCSEFNSGMFDAILEGNSTQAVIAGHDHVNNFGINYKGVLLCYNRSSGFSSYNMLTKHLSETPEQGGTVYRIFEDGSLEIEDILYKDRYDLSEVYRLYDTGK